MGGNLIHPVLIVVCCVILFVMVPDMKEIEDYV